MTGKERLKGHGPEHVYNTLGYINKVLKRKKKKRKREKRKKKKEKKTEVWEEKNHKLPLSRNHSGKIVSGFFDSRN